MKWFLDVAYIAIGASYKWILVGVAVVGILVGVLFAAGVLGGGGDGEPGQIAFATPIPLPTVTPSPTATPAPTPTREPTAAPTPTSAPVVLPTSPAATPTPTPVVVVPTDISVPINLVGADNLGSLEFVLVYEPDALQVTDVQLGSLAGQSLLEFSAATPGLLWTVVIDSDGIDGDGPVAIVNFSVLEGGAANTKLELRDISAFDATSFLDIIVEASVGGFSNTDGALSPPSLTFGQ